MRAIAGQTTGVAREAFAPGSVGAGWTAGARWVLSLPRRWWAAWLRAPALLADDPATFVNHR